MRPRKTCIGCNSYFFTGVGKTSISIPVKESIYICTTPLTIGVYCHLQGIDATGANHIYKTGRSIGMITIPISVSTCGIIDIAERYVCYPFDGIITIDRRIQNSLNMRGGKNKGEYNKNQENDNPRPATLAHPISSLKGYLLTRQPGYHC
jgi:hypothetical protein